MRRNETPRALGPYQSRSRFRVVYRGFAEGESRREAEVFDNFKAAQEAVDRFNTAATTKAKTTIAAAIELYLTWCKGNELKKTTLDTYRHRLHAFFPVGDQKRNLQWLTPKTSQSYYDALVASQKADTHKNTLQEIKRFFRWCLKEKLCQSSPVAHIEEVGRRKKRKSQLRLTEARRFVALAEELLKVLKFPDPIPGLALYGIKPPGWYHGPAQRPKYRAKVQAGIIAALTALLLGVRASEIVERKVRDLDDDGRLLHIEENVKTENSERILVVSELLRPHLLSLALGKEPTDWLFGNRDRRWVLHWAKRLTALAGVKVVTAHGLRGSFASIATAQGAAIHLVSAAMGHGSTSISERNYIEPGSKQSGQSRQVDAIIVPPSFPKPENSPL